MEEVVTKAIIEPCRLVLVAHELRNTPWWRPLDMITVARVYLPAKVGIYLGDGQDIILPGPAWRTSISLVDSIKWSTAPFRQDLVRWVERTSKDKGMSEIKAAIQGLHSHYIMVSTRSGRDTAVDADSEDSQEELASPSTPVPTPQPPDSSSHPQKQPATSSTSLPEPVPAHAPFKFWAQMSPSEQTARRLGRSGRNSKHPIPAVTLEPQPLAGTPVMADTWGEHYSMSADFSGMWLDTQTPDASWPPGVQVHDSKMYFQGKLCVPESLTQKVLWEFHTASGHPGIRRMSKELSHRFVFPTSAHIPALLEGIRRTCTTCQAATPPHFPKEGNLEHFPIPERAMHTVCLDLFAMQPTQWQGQAYDSILLCVDRLSGWIVSCPAFKMGLTAEKAAHLLIDR